MFLNIGVLLSTQLFAVCLTSNTSWKRFSQAVLVVEMGESRTPRPDGPIKECTTGLVDVFAYALRTLIDWIPQRWPSGLK